MNIEKLIEFDKNHIWHPYTSATNPLPCFLVKSANGVYLELQDGRKIIDGMSSWWCAIHGYNNSVLNEAITNQLKNMAHVMFGGITHLQAIELSQKLIEITPENLQRVFFSDSGSVSVEVAMKMAIQYWYSSGKPKKNKFITIRNSYHGDTWHAMSVCDPENGMHNIFKGQLPEQFFVPSPTSTFNGDWNKKDLIPIFEILKNKHSEIAAFILEPIVQGAGGMKFYNPEFLKQVRNICDEFNILLIVDEIATGFGRSGKFWGCNHAEISPDIMCIGKALTGGYMSFAATLCTNKIAEKISESEPGVFMHGPTFMGNPLACAVANASIDLFLKSDWKSNILNIQNQLFEELAILKNNYKVNNVRVLGAIGVVEMKQPVNMAVIQKQFVDEGVWIRPFGKLIYLMPPYIITKSEISKLINAIIKIIIDY